MKKIFTILVIAAVAVGCLNSNKETDRTFEIDSTVSAYFKYIRVEKDKLPIHTIMVADVNTEEMVIMLSLVGNNIASIYDVMNNPGGEKAAEYKKAQEKFGDYNPTPSVFRFFENKNGGEWIIESGYCFYYAFGEQISQLSITSDRAWSNDYPAGKDLAPLFTAEFSSLSSYIAGGFKDSTATDVRKIVSELTASDFSLMLEKDWNLYGGTDLSLHTSVLPDDYYEHKITIALTLDTGEVIEYTERLADVLLW